MGIILIIVPIFYVFVGIFTNFNVDGSIASKGERAAIESQILSENPINTVITSKYTLNVEEVLNPEVIDIPNTGAKSFGNRIIVERIGIDTKIFESKVSKDALDKGVWRMPNFGTPINNYQPTVLSAHRWGADKLSNEYRSKNLFYNLPNLKEGDIIKLIWNGEEYKYKINFMEENTYVSKLEDLILMTCKYYNTPERIIVYAELI